MVRRSKPWLHQTKVTREAQILLYSLTLRQQRLTHFDICSILVYTLTLHVSFKKKFLLVYNGYKVFCCNISIYTYNVPWFGSFPPLFSLFPSLMSL
jgi:hypothetical protein